MIIRKFISYILLKDTKEAGVKANFNLRVMHGINKISILLFLIGMIFLAIKLIK